MPWKKSIDFLLTSFYQLDDEARKEIVETLRFKLQYHKDPERAEQIKGWEFHAINAIIIVL